MGERASKSKHRRLIIVLIAAVGIAVVVLCPLWMAGIISLPSVDKQLARIEAERAIPDSENAATIYDPILEGLGGPVSLDECDDDICKWVTDDLGREVSQLARSEMQLQDMQRSLCSLLHASRMEKCRLPLRMVVNLGKLSPLRVSIDQLILSADSNAWSGKIDVAVEKYLAAIRIARHFQQQPLTWYIRDGSDTEGAVLDAISHFMAHGNVTEEHLAYIETHLDEINDNRGPNSEELAQVTTLVCEDAVFARNTNLLVRWKHKLFDQRYLEAEIKGMVQVVTDEYSRLKAKRHRRRRRIQRLRRRPDLADQADDVRKGKERGEWQVRNRY